MTVTLDLPRARFACTGCAVCCRSDWAIPVAPGEAAALDDFFGGSAVWHRHAAGQPQMKRAHSGCALLTADNRCAVHAARGEAAKPLACQLYPVSFVRTPDGMTVVLAFDCPGVHWPGEPDAATAAVAQKLLPLASGIGMVAEDLHHAGRKLRWPDYCRWRDWLLMESTGAIRPRDLLLLAVRGAAALALAGAAWQPPAAEQRMDWLMPFAGTDKPAVRRQALALALLLAAAGRDRAGGGESPRGSRQLRGMLRPGAVWQVMGEEHPVAELETVAEQLDAGAEELLRAYLGELLRRHTAAGGGGDLDLNLRLLALLYRLTLLHAAALARTAGGARLGGEVMRRAARQVDRQFALHLRVVGDHPLFNLAQAWGVRQLRHRQYYASMV